jgi:hypothetical protein
MAGFDKSGVPIEYPGAISSFSGGIVDDLREPQSDRFGISQHFDIFSNPFRLTPYRDTTAESDATSAAHLAALDLRHFKLGSNGKMYALGTDGSGHAQVFVKTDPTTGNWAPGTTAISAAARVTGAFIEWQGKFYMFTGTNKLSSWNFTTNTFTDTEATLGSTIVTVAHGVIGADGNLYMFYNNNVIRISSAGVVTDAVLANLPSNMRITSACNYSSYIFITMAFGTSATASPTGRSTGFVWDMVTTTTINQAVDLGEGAAMVCGNIEGRVCIVSNKYMETPSGLTSLAAGYGSVVIRLWGGAQAVVMKEIIANQAVTLGRFIQDVVIKNNIMYWVMSVPLAPDSTSTESTYNLGIWAFGRKNTAMKFAVTLDTIENAVDTSNYFINSFGAAGNYWFFNHSAAFNVTKTANTVTYTNTAFYESAIFNFIFGLRHRHISDSAFLKQLKGVSLTFDPLPAGATGILKFRKDSDTAWTQIFTYSSTNGIKHDAIGIENITLGGDTVTMTIASPAVVSLTAHKLVAGQIIRFTTTGALPTGVQAGLNYYVISTGLTANAFEFSATSGGSAVNTSGSQSGTHTLDRTVALPTYREIQFRIESTGGCIVTGFKFLFDELEAGAWD